ncbi:arylsulfatase J-like isoform X2 [Amphiura filiformis]|uniref:arylsulfatase J-like isoform X2 n=1 Tax=Amphiura filiformis TaxID=82378 RepID=UPI003B21BBA9
MKNYYSMLCVTLMTLVAVFDTCGAAKPHIIFIIADDLGWNDVSFHGSDQIPTPNIDKLANDGVSLFNYYVSPICTPTRSAVMTGRHPIHTGMQHQTVGGPTPYGLPLNETTIAQRLKTLGYMTHMVGKWHLGYFAEEYTPTRRGFDTHIGYYLGSGDYFDHTSKEKGYWGYDFWQNGEIYKPVFGQYSTELYTTAAMEVLQQHDPSKPLFLYVAYQAVHSANPDQPLQAPYKYIKRFSTIKNTKRRTFAAMVSAMDDSIGYIAQTLKDTGLYNNSVIFFTTDNGGPSAGFDYNYANNWPLRGRKNTMWEGGVRGTGFVNSPLLEKPGRISEDMLHVCDWFPTMYKLAGGNVGELTNLDGYDVWDTLSKGVASPRTEILHNIDPIFNFSALRSGDYKIVIGRNNAGSGWYFPEGVDKDESVSVRKFGREREMVYCPPKPVNASTNCNSTIAPCLFNIRNDPCEFYNIAPWNQDLVKELQARVQAWNATAVTPANQPIDPKADPKLHGGYWVPWVNLTQSKAIV